MSLLHYATSFELKLPYLNGHQEVHHRLVTLIFETKLRDRHVSDYALFPACPLSQRHPQSCLAVPPPTAVAKEVHLRLGQCTSTQGAFVDISVAETFQGDCTGHMLGHWSVGPGGQRVFTCHSNRSFGPHFALQSVADVLATFVGIPLCFGC